MTWMLIYCRYKDRKLIDTDTVHSLKMFHFVSSDIHYIENRFT